MGLRVVLTGAAGRMGRSIGSGLVADSDVKLVGAVDQQHLGEDFGELIGGQPVGTIITNDLRRVIDLKEPNILVDFTAPESVMNNAQIALQNGLRAVLGTTGLRQRDLDVLFELCEKHQTSALVAPNFAIGAVLMMKFAEQAARFFQDVEIIELHHDQKIDAPSGTALRTADIIAGISEKKTDGKSLGGTDDRSRGINHRGVTVHSVRLPGLVAHQEVIFGGLGQTLTIRHDSITRESFIPGVLLAVKQIKQTKGLIIGLENLLEL